MLRPVVTATQVPPGARTRRSSRTAVLRSGTRSSRWAASTTPNAPSTSNAVTSALISAGSAAPRSRPNERSHPTAFIRRSRSARRMDPMPTAGIEHPRPWPQPGQIQHPRGDVEGGDLALPQALPGTQVAVVGVLPGRIQCHPLAMPGRRPGRGRRGYPRRRPGHGVIRPKLRTLAPEARLAFEMGHRMAAPRASRACMKPSTPRPPPLPTSARPSQPGPPVERRPMTRAEHPGPRRQRGENSPDGP